MLFVRECLRRMNPSTTIHTEMDRLVYTHVSDAYACVCVWRANERIVHKLGLGGRLWRAAKSKLINSHIWKEDTRDKHAHLMAYVLMGKGGKVYR